MGPLNAALGRNKITRLLHIARSSPSLAGPALTLALSAIKALTLDTRLYEDAYYQYRTLIDAVEKGEETDPQAKAWYEQQRGQGSFAPFDRAWFEKAKQEAHSGQDRLEIELKGYLTNLIKESIRVRRRLIALPLRLETS